MSNNRDKNRKINDTTITFFEKNPLFFQFFYWVMILSLANFNMSIFTPAWSK